MNNDSTIMLVCTTAGIVVGVYVGSIGIAIGGSAYGIAGWIWGGTAGASIGSFLANLF